MANNIVVLERWIRRQMTDEVLTNNGERKCIAIGLLHYKNGIKDEVQTIKLGSKEWDPKQLADLLNGIADEVASGIIPDESGSGYEQFEVVSFFSDTPDIVVGRCLINRKTGNVIAPSTVASEPPDARGLLKQDMRHREAWGQFTLDIVARSYSMLLTVNENLMKRNGQLERENYDAVELAKETIFRQAADTHAHEMAELEYSRKSEERARIMKLLPAAVNQLMGREVFPSSTVDSDLLETFVGSLKPEAVQEVIGVLGKHMKQEELGMLVGRMLEIQERINEKNAEKAKREAEKQARNGIVKTETEPS